MRKGGERLRQGRTEIMKSMRRLLGWHVYLLSWLCDGFEAIYVYGKTCQIVHFLHTDFIVHRLLLRKKKIYFLPSAKEYIVCWNEINKSVDTRKKWKILFQAKLRIVTWEEHLRKLWELFHISEVKASNISFWDTGLYIKWCLTENLHNPDLRVSLLWST